MSVDACAPTWRWGRPFQQAEIDARLAGLERCPSTGPSSDAEAARDPAWNHYFSEALIAREGAGPPELGGAFQRARSYIEHYGFSDPSIVQGHFSADSELRGRRMLLELKVLGLRFLCGVAVRDTRDETNTARSVFGFRYDTLQGHAEAGAEWFLLTKDHTTGEVRFRIQAAWRQGELPNWWTEIGFHALSRRYQRAWHRNAYLRLRTFVQACDLPPLPHGRLLLQAWTPPVGPVAPDAPIAEQET